MLFYSFFKTLVQTRVRVHLKNDLVLEGLLLSVDQYLNCKLDQVVAVGGPGAEMDLDGVEGVELDPGQLFPHVVCDF
jgi:small nuclear ribonucleoprotein (snRNP)-like protein